METGGNVGGAPDDEGEGDDEVEGEAEVEVELEGEAEDDGDPPGGSTGRIFTSPLPTGVTTTRGASANTGKPHAPTAKLATTAASDPKRVKRECIGTTAADSNTATGPRQFAAGAALTISSRYG